LTISAWLAVGKEISKSQVYGYDVILEIGWQVCVVGGQQYAIKSRHYIQLMAARIITLLAWLSSSHLNPSRFLRRAGGRGYESPVKYLRVSNVHKERFAFFICSSGLMHLAKYVLQEGQINSINVPTKERFAFFICSSGLMYFAMFHKWGRCIAC
jgi:hypothetical protein